jgi:hypothetical protein
VILQPEERASIDFVDAFRRQWPRLDGHLVHVPNQRRVSPGRRGAVTHALLVRMGFRKGCSDYILAWPVAPFHGLWLEMKAEGGSVTSEQLEHLAKMRNVGYASCVTWGTWAALYAVQEYLGGRGSALFGAVVGFPATEPALDPGYSGLPIERLTLTGTPRRR